MDFELTETETSVGRLAEQILTDLVTDPSLREIERSHTWLHRPAWAALAQAGLLGVAVPEIHGGSDAGLLALCQLLRQVGRSTAPLPVLSTLVMGALPIARHATEAQQRRFLPRVVSGQTHLTAALEQHGSRDLVRPAVVASPTRTGLTLEGTCVQVPGLPEAERVLIPASARTRTVLCLVDPRAPGASLTRSTATNDEPLHALSLSGVEVDRAEIVAGEATGQQALEDTVQVTSLGVSALSLGVAERALSMTAAYVTERQQFGRPIGSFQAVSQRAANAYIDLTAMEVSLWQAAFRLQAGLPAAREVAIARFAAIEGTHRIVMTSQHLHGGIGFDRDYPLHRSLLWAKRLEPVVGGSEIQLEQIGSLLAASERP